MDPLSGRNGRKGGTPALKSYITHKTQDKKKGPPLGPFLEICFR